MIYGDIIREQSFESLINHMNILKEYYENEISMLNSVISYQNESSVITESYELEALQEGFIEDTKKKIKEIIDKFVKWIRKVISNIKNRKKPEPDSENTDGKKEVEIYF